MGMGMDMGMGYGVKYCPNAKAVISFLSTGKRANRFPSLRIAALDLIVSSRREPLLSFALLFALLSSSSPSPNLNTLAVVSSITFFTSSDPSHSLLSCFLLVFLLIATSRTISILILVYGLT